MSDPAANTNTHLAKEARCALATITDAVDLLDVLTNNGLLTEEANAKRIFPKGALWTLREKLVFAKVTLRQAIHQEPNP